MSLHTYIERIRFIDCLIRKKATGNARTLGKKLNLSRSQTMEFLKEMREAGFPIEYSRKHNCYYYSIDGRLVNNLFERNINEPDTPLKELPESKLKKAWGGKDFSAFLFSPIISDCRIDNFIK